MAVYERTYKRYTGDVAPDWARFLVLPRYALGEIFASKFFLALFVSSFLFPLAMAGLIYLRHNAPFLEAFPDFPIDQFLRIDAAFFRRLMNVQTWWAFVLTLLVGPGLVSRDLANNALPLYLSRPFSRAEYLLGKLSILALLLSATTWVVGWGLFALQGTLAGDGWAGENARVAAAVFTGSWTWIVALSLLALALSAWVRWRPLASFLMLMVLLAGSFFGNLANALFRIDWGNVFNLPVVMATVWDHLFGLESRTGVPFGLALLALAALAGLSLLLLHRKIRAYEVVG